MKHLELFIGLSAVPFMTLWWFLPESPRWLLSKGRNEEALKSLEMVCKWNNKAMNFDSLQLKSYNEEKGKKKASIKDLIKYPATRRNALCMTFCWLAFSMGYFGLVYNTPAFDWNIYLVFVFPTFFLIPTTFLQPLFENKLGRKSFLTFPLLLAGLLLLLTTGVPKGIPVIVLAWIGTVSCSVAFGDGYTYTKELFPTILRYIQSKNDLNLTLK